MSSEETATFDRRASRDQLLARIDERTLHMTNTLQAIEQHGKETRNEVGHISQRVSVMEEINDTHKWAIRLIVAALILGTVGLFQAARAGEQVAIPQSAIDNAFAVLTTQVWSLIGLVLIGMALGMCSVGIARIFMSDLEGGTPRQWVDRSRFLKKFGAATSALWTAPIIYGYLNEALHLSAWLSLVVALGLGVIAAACNHPAFKPVKAIWRWLVGKLKRKIESDGGSASDLDDTDFKR